MYFLPILLGARYYNKWNVIFCLSVSCFKVMNKKWNENRFHILRACTTRTTYISSERQNLLAKYCRRNQGWNGLPAIIEILKIGRCTRAEVKVPRRMIRSQFRTVARGGCDKRVGWFNNAARSSEAPVRRAGADNHRRTTCARLCLSMCKGAPRTYRSRWARSVQWFPNYFQTQTR